MASDPKIPGGRAPGDATASSGLGARAGSKIGGSLVDTLHSSIWDKLLIAPLFAYGALWFADVAPSPVEIVGRIGETVDQSPTPHRSVGIAEVKALGDGASGALARAIQVQVTSRLRQMPDTFGGVRVQYALGPVTSGRGAISATSLRWALAAEGTDWRYCADVPLSFTAQRGLADQVASQINNSLLASETEGDLQCG